MFKVNRDGKLIRVFPRSYFPAIHIIGLLNSNQMGHAVDHFNTIRDGSVKCFVYGYMTGLLNHTVSSKARLRQFKFLIRNPV